MFKIFLWSLTSLFGKPYEIPFWNYIIDDYYIYFLNLFLLIITHSFFSKCKLIFFQTVKKLFNNKKHDFLINLIFVLFFQSCPKLGNFLIYFSIKFEFFVLFFFHWKTMKFLYTFQHRHSTKNFNFFCHL